MKKNLIFLHTNNGNGLSIVGTQGKVPTDITVNTQNRTWTYRGETTPFGQGWQRQWGGAGFPVGFFDPDHPGDMVNMVSVTNRFAQEIANRGHGE